MISRKSISPCKPCKTPSRILFCLVLASALFFGATVQAASGVRVEFSQSLKYFEKGEMAKSLKLLKRMIKKYPEFKASYFLIGRIYYHYGEYKKAAKWFAKGGSQFVSQDNGFEYGVAMFTVNRCQSSRYGFSQVPNNDPQKDIARFYMAICYIKDRAWSQAEQSFRQAKVLPQYLAQKKRFFLREISQKKQAEMRGQFSRPMPLAANRNYVPPPQQIQRDPYRGAPPPLPGQPPGAPEKKTPAPSAPAPKPRTGLYILATPKVEYQNKSMTADFHGTGEFTRTWDGPLWEAKIDPNFALTPDRYERQVVFNAPILYKGRNLRRTDKDVRYFLEGGDTFVTKEREFVTNSKQFELGVLPGVLIPFGEFFEIQPQAIIRQVFPQNKSEMAITQMGGVLSADLSLDNFSVAFRGQFQNESQSSRIAEQKGQTISTGYMNIRGDVGVSLIGLELNSAVEYYSNSNKDFRSDELTDKLLGFASALYFEAGLSKTFAGLTLALMGSSLNREPPTEYVAEGTASEWRFTGKAGYAFEFGLSINGSASYVNIDEFNKIGLKKNEDIADDNAATSSVAATGVRNVFTADIKVTPISWGYFSASYEFVKTDYTLMDPNYQTSFEQNVSEISYATIYLIGLSYTF